MPVIYISRLATRKELDLNGAFMHIATVFCIPLKLYFFSSNLLAVLNHKIYADYIR